MMESCTVHGLTVGGELIVTLFGGQLIVQLSTVDMMFALGNGSVYSQLVN